MASVGDTSLDKITFAMKVSRIKVVYKIKVATELFYSTTDKVLPHKLHVVVLK